MSNHTSLTSLTPPKLQQSKSFHVSKTAVSLGTTLVDVEKYYEPTEEGLKLTKELIRTCLMGALDKDHFMTVVDLIMKRDDIRSLKVYTITRFKMNVF